MTIKKATLYIVFLLLAANPIKVLFAAYYDNQKVEQLNNQVQQMNQEINSRKSQIAKQREQQDRYYESLQNKQAESATLSNQVAIMDNRLKKTELDIDDLNVDISLVQLEVQKTGTEIETANFEIGKKEENLATSLRSLYKKKEDNFVEILILNNNLSDFLNQVQYLEDINSNVKKGLTQLDNDKKSLEEKKQNLIIKNQKLHDLKAELDRKLSLLETEKESKLSLLEETKSSEEEYKQLLAQAKAEQLRAQSDITQLEKTVRDKLAEIEKNKLQFNDKGFIWPVPPNTITAYFHDTSYPFRHIFEHPAIDVSAKQGTTIRSAASGYVAIAKNAGTGYSYVMIIHGDGLSTVYGHVSQIFVKADQYVTQGQEIGLSGGRPGTAGAGRLTTGPHLHFEIRSNGIPVNPLKYLQ